MSSKVASSEYSLRCCIVRFPGTNREGDLQRALSRLSTREVSIIDSESSSLPTNIDAIFLGGGFSWGDYLRAGACAARAKIIPHLQRRASDGTLIVGICNGFQILTEAGLLPGALMRNFSGRFVCRWQELDWQESSRQAPNGKRIDKRIILPLAHSDGRYVATPETLARLEDEGGIFLRYATDALRVSPNGSAHDIAGICNSSGRIFGLMPHPENAIEDFHESQDGLELLRALLGYAQGERRQSSDTKISTSIAA